MTVSRNSDSVDEGPANYTDLLKGMCAPVPRLLAPALAPAQVAAVSPATSMDPQRFSRCYRYLSIYRSELHNRW